VKPGGGHDSDAAAMLPVFAFLWAVAHGYHEAKWSHWLSTPSDFALGVAVALVLLRPAAIWRLASMAAVQLVNVAVLLPHVANHYLILALGNVALLLAFAPPDFARALSQWSRGHVPARLAAWLDDDRWYRRVETTVYVALALAVCAVTSMQPWTYSGEASLLVREVTSGTRPPLSYFFQAAWFPYYLGAMGVFVAVLGSTDRDDRGAGELLRAPSPILLVVPLLALLNGLSPYVGLRTEGTFAMFSNLRTEGSSPNHLLVRTTLDPFGLQSDLVRVIDSNDSELAKLAERGLSIPTHQLAHHVASVTADGAGTIRIVYERGGITKTTEDAAADPELAVESSLLASKLLAFRPIEPSGPVRCRH
jgi:hypothetical protein